MIHEDSVAMAISTIRRCPVQRGHHSWNRRMPDAPLYIADPPRQLHRRSNQWFLRIHESGAPTTPWCGERGGQIDNTRALIVVCQCARTPCKERSLEAAKTSERRPLTTRSPALPDFDHDPPAYPSLDDLPAGVHDAGQIDLAGHAGEFVSIEIGCQSPPGLASPFQGAHHGIDADERHSAQNEWRNCGRKIHSAGQPAGGDRAAIARHRQHVGQCGRPNTVNAAGPPFLAERPDGADKLLAFNNLAGAQVPEVIRFRWT